MGGASNEFDDPPDMCPDDERMTSAEFVVVLQFLGIPHEWLARRLNVQDRTIRRWAAGSHPIPDFVRLAIEDLEAETAAFVGAGVEALYQERDPGLITYRSDADYRAHHPEVDWPASWHRAVAARIAQEVHGLPIEWWKPDETP